MRIYLYLLNLNKFILFEFKSAHPPKTWNMINNVCKRNKICFFLFLFAKTFTNFFAISFLSDLNYVKYFTKNITSNTQKTIQCS